MTWRLFWVFPSCVLLLQPIVSLPLLYLYPGNFYGAEGGTIPQIFCSRWMKDIKSHPFKRKRKNEKRKIGYLLQPVLSPSQPIFPFVPSLPSFSTCSLPLSAPLFPFFPIFSSIAERLLLHGWLCSPHFSIGPWLVVSHALISTLLHRRPSCPP